MSVVVSLQDLGSCRKQLTVEVPAPSAGVLSDIKVPQGTTVAVGSVLGSIKEGAGAPAQQAAKAPEAKPAAAAPRPAAPATPTPARAEMPPAPAARKMMEEKGLSPSDLQGSLGASYVVKNFGQNGATMLKNGDNSPTPELFARAALRPLTPHQYAMSLMLVTGDGSYARQPIAVRAMGGAILALRDAAAPYPIDLQLDNGPTRITLKGHIQDPLALKLISADFATSRDAVER